MRWVCIVAAASLLTLSCGGDDTDSDTTTTAAPVTLSSPSSTTSTTSSTTSTTAAVEGLVAVEVTEDLDVTSSRTMDVYEPTEAGPWPVVVMWHGQPGDKAGMSPFAAVVAEQGAVVFNASYSAATPAEGMNDTGCSLQLAVESAADFGGDPERVVVLGTSFGGATALVWGLDSPFRAEPFTDCVADADSVQVLPDAVVAVASGTNPRDFPVPAWQQADDAVLDALTPILLVGGNPDLQAFFGTQNERPPAAGTPTAGPLATPEESIAIHEALLAAGYESTLVALGGTHDTAAHPDSPEFPRLVDLVVAALDAVR